MKSIDIFLNKSNINALFYKVYYLPIFSDDPFFPSPDDCWSMIDKYFTKLQLLNSINSKILQVLQTIID